MRTSKAEADIEIKSCKAVPKSKFSTAFFLFSLRIKTKFLFRKCFQLTGHQQKLTGEQKGNIGFIFNIKVFDNEKEVKLKSAENNKLIL